MALTIPPLSLYIHFPWCVRKCPYCDFNSHTLHGELPVDAYLAALLEDFRAQLPFVAGREFRTLFLGGGTPSLFPPEAIDRLLRELRSLAAFSPGAEVTLEANPGTIERGRFADYRAAGINRVSLGAQSFGPRQLERLGRIHSADETRRAAEELHAAGLTNFNLDLMVGLPEQNLAGALADVHEALKLRPAHLSHYQLTMEPGTVFGGRPPAGLPGDDEAADLQLQCQQLLEASGFRQYEVSAFARDGHRCAHNLNYWTFGDYVGIGAGAHGKRTDVQRDRIERTVREREPRRYLARGSTGLAPSQFVRASDRPFEFMMNALRLNEGFAIELFEERTGTEWTSLSTPVGALVNRGLLLIEDRRCRVSATGGRFLNDVLGEFLALPRPKRSGLGPKNPDLPKA